MKFRITLIFSLGCLFSCLFIASCEEGFSQVSVYGRERRDTRRRQVDSNESDDRDDDDDDHRRKEYSRRLALQKVLRKLRRLPLSRRQLVKLVSRLRKHKKSNKPITMTVIRDIMKDVVGKKSKNRDVVSKAKQSATPMTTTVHKVEKKTDKNIPSITDGQLVSVKKAPKKPEVAKEPQQKEPPKKDIPVVYQPPVVKVEKITPPKISTPYIPPPKPVQPVVKVKKIQPQPPAATEVKSDVQVIPTANGNDVAVDTRFTPELKLNINNIPVKLRTQALFQRLKILRQRLHNFKKLRDRQNIVRTNKKEIVKTSLSGLGSPSTSSVASAQTKTAVKAVAYASDIEKPFSLSSPGLKQSSVVTVAHASVKPTKPVGLSSPKLTQHVHSINTDKTESVLQTQNYDTAPVNTGISNLSPPSSSALVPSVEMTQDESSRVKKIIMVIQRLASRSGSKKLQVSSKAKDLLIKWVRRYKNAMKAKQVQPHVETRVQYSVSSGLHNVPIDQVGTKSLQRNIPLSSTAELANPNMMENDVIKQKIEKKAKDGSPKVSNSILENSKDIYISDSPQAKSHFKTSSNTSSKKPEQTVVENNEPTSSSSLPKSFKSNAKITFPLSSQSIKDAKINSDITKTDIKADFIETKKSETETSNTNFKQALRSKTTKESQTNELESMIKEAPKHIYATFLPPIIEDPSLKEKQTSEIIGKKDKDSEAQNIRLVEESPVIPHALQENNKEVTNLVQTQPDGVSMNSETPKALSGIPIPVVENEVTTPVLKQSVDTTTSATVQSFGEQISHDPYVPVELPVDESKSIFQTPTPSLDTASELNTIPEETKVTPNFPDATTVNQAGINNVVEANLDESPYKRLPSKQTDQLQKESQKHNSNTENIISKPNVIPLFQQETKNTFFKDVNKTPIDTTSIESNSIKELQQKERPNADESVSKSRDISVFNQIGKHTNAVNKMFHHNNDISFDKKQKTNQGHLLSASQELSSNTVNVFKPSAKNIFDKPLSKSIPDFENSTLTSVTETNKQSASHIEVHHGGENQFIPPPPPPPLSFSTTVTKTNEQPISRSVSNVEENQYIPPPPTSPRKTDNLPTLSKENPNIKLSLPGVVIESSFLDSKVTGNVQQAPQSSVENTVKEIPSASTKSIQSQGSAVVISNPAPVQKQNEIKKASNGNINNLTIKPTNIVDIKSSFNDKNINRILPKHEHISDLPPLQLHFNNQPSMVKTHQIASSSQKQSNHNTEKVNIPSKSLPKFQISRTNVAQPWNRAKNQRASSTFVVSQPKRPETEFNRLGSTSLDKAAILRKLLEIRRMREQLIATGKVNDRRLSDLIPKSRSSISNTRPTSRPQQSSSLSQNTVVFWGDSTKPSLTNPLGTSRAHRRKRSLLSGHMIPGNIMPHTNNQIYIDMPLHSLSYDKKRSSRVDLFGGLGSPSIAHSHPGRSRADIANPGSLSLGPVHPNTFHDRGMTKLERFFRKPVYYTPQPQMQNIAAVVNKIFAPRKSFQQQQLFAGNSLSTSFSNKPHHRPFHLNGSERKSPYAAKQTLSGLPKKRNFVESAPVKLRTSNSHGVRISVRNDVSAGSLTHQHNSLRIRNKKTIDTSYMDNSLSLGPPKPDRPKYRTVRRIVILPLRAPTPTVPTVRNTKQNKDMGLKPSQLNTEQQKSLKQSSQTGYLTKAKPEMKPYKHTSVEYKTIPLSSKTDAPKASKSETHQSNSKTVEQSKSQYTENKLTSITMSQHHSGTHAPKSLHTGNNLSLSPPQHKQKMKDSTSFVKFAFSLNSPTSLFMNNMETQATNVSPVKTGYSGSISAAPNSVLRARAGKDKAGPVLSATSFVGQKSSNNGIVFEEIDPLSLTNFILAANEGPSSGFSGGPEISMSTAPIRLRDNTVENSVVLEIPEKKDFIGTSTQKEKKSEIVGKENKKQYDTTLANRIQEKEHHRHTAVKPVSDKTNPKTSASVSPSHHLRTSQTSHRPNPYTFSLSGISLSSHTHSPKTTVPHSVKPTIKPTLGVPVLHVTNKAAQHTSTQQTQNKRESLSKHQSMQNSLTKQSLMENSRHKYRYPEIINTDHQHTGNSRIKYLPLKNSLTGSHMKSENKFTKSPSGDYVHHSPSLTSFNPRKSTHAYKTVGHNFDINDKFTPKYTYLPHTGHSSVSYTATTTPSSRIVMYNITTPSWQHRNSLSNHVSGKIGHYKMQSFIEKQTNGLSFSEHNQLQGHQNQVDRSSPSVGRQSTNTITHFDQQTGHTLQRPAPKASPHNIENTINYSKSWNTQKSSNTIDNSKQWSNKDLLVSKPLNAERNYQNHISKRTGMHGFAISRPINSEPKHSWQITRPTSSPGIRISQRTPVDLKNTKIQHVIRNKIYNERQSGWATPNPLQTLKSSAMNKIHATLRQQTKPDIRYKQHLQHPQGHRTVIKTQQHSHSTAGSTLQQPTQAVTPPTPRHSHRTTLGVTNRPHLPVTQKSAETTKVAFFSTGTESYAVSPQLLAILRQLPVGDLPDHKKRRLEKILRVENGQLEEKSPEPLSDVNALNNAIHEQSIKNGKARQFEVSHQKLTSNNLRYVQPTFNGANNENVKTSLGAFFAS
ncbi:uncharacterized protein LOC133197234 [Saccostrea echinata]|uniref:uncharacterized protein LOC133197234 n=1 Tax=Saccostrea echinata TaxID=191078 RepID=UPI002A81A5F7|nr:uncharacterized protein LOC133197234 [Saccostrea echinata]